MNVQQSLFMAAAIAGLISCALHAFAGGAIMARPFYRKAKAAGVPTQAFRYCWHFVSMILFATAFGFGYLSLRPADTAFAIYLTATACGFSALSVGVSMIEGSTPLKSPPAILGAIIGGFGLAALFTG